MWLWVHLCLHSFWCAFFLCESKYYWYFRSLVAMNTAIEARSSYMCSTTSSCIIRITRPTPNNLPHAQSLIACQLTVGVVPAYLFLYSHVCCGRWRAFQSFPFALTHLFHLYLPFRCHSATIKRHFFVLRQVWSINECSDMQLIVLIRRGLQLK